MNREIIPFTTEEAWLKNRVHDLTSSDIPCLFGVGYQTWQEVWYSKKNKIQNKIEETEEMKWGKAFEPEIAKEHARRNNWNIRRKDEYIRIPSIRLASSFDYAIVDDRYQDIALLEAKNVNQFKYKKDWKEGFSIESTPYIELQIQNELLVSGLNIGYICACIGGFKGVCLKREANKKVQEAILKKAEMFWRSIDESK